MPARTGPRATEPCPNCGWVIDREQHFRHVPSCIKVREYLEQGFEDGEIAELMNLKPESVARYRRKMNIEIQHREPKIYPRKVTPEVQERIDELTADWWPRTEIAAELNLHRDTVALYAGHPEVGKAWRAVQRWAAKNCPDLFDDIKRMEIA